MLLRIRLADHSLFPLEVTDLIAPACCGNSVSEWDSNFQVQLELVVDCILIKFFLDQGPPWGRERQQVGRLYILEPKERQQKCPIFCCQGDISFRHKGVICVVAAYRVMTLPKQAFW